jgi:hypothetical protein
VSRRAAAPSNIGTHGSSPAARASDRKATRVLSAGASQQLCVACQAGVSEKLWITPDCDQRHGTRTAHKSPVTRTDEDRVGPVSTGDIFVQVPPPTPNKRLIERWYSGYGR